MVWTRADVLLAAIGALCAVILVVALVGFWRTSVGPFRASKKRSRKKVEKALNAVRDEGNAPMAPEVKFHLEYECDPASVEDELKTVVRVLNDIAGILNAHYKGGDSE